MFQGTVFTLLVRNVAFELYYPVSSRLPNPVVPREAPGQPPLPRQAYTISEMATVKPGFPGNLTGEQQAAVSHPPPLCSLLRTKQS